MNIDEAAAATGCYFITRVDFNDFFVGTQDTHAGSFKTYADARAACDRLNLRAVLEAIREPSEVMVAEGEAAYVYHPKNIWSEMIDALIAEVGK